MTSATACSISIGEAHDAEPPRTEVATFIMEQGICYEEFYKHYFPEFEY